jgi:transcriptional regulator with XRE-family HTH domain
MADNSAFSERLLTQQKAMFRQAALAGFSQDRIHNETGISTTSLSEWATGKVKLSLIGLLRISAVEDFPSALLSLLFNGTGRYVGDENDGDLDLDALGEEADAIATEVRRARHPASPGGTNIVPIERQAILGRRRSLRAA